MGKIKKILENELVGGTQTTDVYPVTSTKAVYNEDNENLDNILNSITEKLNTKVNTSAIVQQTGDSTTSVMSQKAVTDAIQAEIDRATAAEKANAQAIAEEKAATQVKVEELNGKIDTQKNEINVAKEEALQAIAENEQSAITNFNSQRVTPEMLSESTKQLIEASGGGTVTNLADDEDLTSVDDGTGSNVLKFADRTYNANNFSGKGYKILRKNIVNGKNILTQDMINEHNTIYEIRYDFDLNGEEITIPEGCILFFIGGNLNNGVLNGNSTCIYASAYHIFKENLSIKGTYNNDKVFCEWFGAKGNGIDNDTTYVQKTIDCFNKVNFCAKPYLLNKIILHDYTYIDGIYHQTIIKTTPTEDFNIDKVLTYKTAECIFYAYDKAFITIKNLDFQLGNADYCSAIILDNSETNGAGITFDLRPTITDITVDGGYYSLYINGFIREARVTNFVSYNAHSDYALYIRGTDNTILNCTTGGSYFGGIYVAQNCRLNNIKCFVAHKYYQNTKDESNFDPKKNYALYLNGSYINAVNVDLQQNVCNGMLLAGASNYVQGVFNAAGGYTRPKASESNCANIVVKNGAVGNVIDCVQTTAFLNSYCTHYIYMLSPFYSYNNEFNISTHQTSDAAKVSIINILGFNKVTVNGNPLNYNIVPINYVKNNSDSDFIKYENFLYGKLSNGIGKQFSIDISGIIDKNSEFIIDIDTFANLDFTYASSFIKCGTLTTALYVNDTAYDIRNHDVKPGINKFSITYKVHTILDLTITTRDKVKLSISYTSEIDSSIINISYPKIIVFKNRESFGSINILPIINPIIPTKEGLDIYNDGKKLLVKYANDKPYIQLKDSYNVMFNFPSETSKDFHWVKLFKFDHNQISVISFIYNNRTKITYYSFNDKIAPNYVSDTLPEFRIIKEASSKYVYCKLKAPYDKLFVEDSVISGEWFGVIYDKNVDYTEIEELKNSTKCVVLNESDSTTRNGIFLTNSSRDLFFSKMGSFYKIEAFKYNVLKSGTFDQKPTSSEHSIQVGFAYFCTDRQTAEGSNNGIMIYHKGNDIWVDALGRIVS